MDKKSGISSLNKRLEKLEKNKETVLVDDQLSMLISRLETKAKDKKKEQMNDILNHFEDDLIKNNNNILLENHIETIIFTIKYIESNSSRLSILLTQILSSEFKKNICCSFLKHIYNESLCDEYLDFAIDSIHKLMYPKINEPIVLTRTETVKKKKKFGF